MFYPSCLFLFYFSYINIINIKANESADVAEELYKRLFQRQRVEQLEAIKSFKRITSYEKQYSMIVLMAEKVFTSIQDNRAIIEASPFIPGVSEFPLDDTIRNSLSNILENTALFSEIIIRFPDISESVLKINNNWDVLLQWGIAFSNQVKYLLDSNTIKLLYLVGQELNHIDRHPTYINPYRKVTQEVELSEEIRKKTKKKKNIKRGPKLSNHFEL